MNLIWFLCWFSDSIIDGFARTVLAFAELSVVSTLLFLLISRLIILPILRLVSPLFFFDAFPTDYSLVITVNLPKR